MSLLIYGCEAWALTPAIQARINGANSRCIARITGRTTHSEASPRTQTFDLVTAIKARMWKCFGPNPNPNPNPDPNPNLKPNPNPHPNPDPIHYPHIHQAHGGAQRVLRGLGR